MRYTGIQPQYFPRLHYFARILDADIFMIRDDVQFVRDHKYPSGKRDKSYQAHTPIKHIVGTKLLSISVRNKTQPIIGTEIAYEYPWPEDHRKVLKIAYRNALNFSFIQSEINEVLSTEYPNLAELNIATMFWGLMRLLGNENITTKDLNLDSVNQKLAAQSQFRLKGIRRATQSKVANDLVLMSANEKIIALCKEVGAIEDYCGGTAAAAYMDEQLYKKNGISMVVQDWKCRQYSQMFTAQHGFSPNLSVIDLLMNVPTKEAIRIIKG